MRRIAMALLVGVAVVGVGGCACWLGGGSGNQGHMAKSGDAKACPMCAKGMAGESVWCDHCNAGFVHGEKVACKGCFAAKTGGPPCPKCSKM